MNGNNKDTIVEGRKMETTRDGRQIVYETDEERQERMRWERLGDVIELRLNKVLEARERAKEKPSEKNGDIFKELFG